MEASTLSALQTNSACEYLIQTGAAHFIPSAQAEANGECVEANARHRENDAEGMIFTSCY
ncbi:hypothetical protein [Gimesia maris]|uniref:hypothetical protein n=1 Tax=Gimesia maris TaxID=122 RepID=UPI003A8E6481